MNSNFSQMQMTEKKKAKEIDLKELYSVIKRRLWVIVIFTLLAGAAGILQTMKPVTPLYQTSSKIIIGADDETRTTLQVIIKDYTILDKVVQELNLKETSDALAGQITVASVGGSQVVSISVMDTNPFRAANIADTTAAVFKDEIPKIVGQNYVRLLSDAKINTTPINPPSDKKILYYFIIGLVAGVGLGFLLESLDDTIRSDREIEQILGAPLLGRISKMTNKNLKKKKNAQPNLEHRGEIVGYE